MGTETVHGYGPRCHTWELGIEIRYPVSDLDQRARATGITRTPWQGSRRTWITTH